jgi:hypothetical protein
MSVTFATPYAALGGLVGLLAVAIAAARLTRARRVRRELGLSGPGSLAQLRRPLALACVFGLLGLAAAQPAIRTQHERRARTDAEVMVVLDSSRSMVASPGPTGTPRYLRAVAFAHRLHAAMPQVPVGVSSLTNRLLPYLFPTSDGRAYDLVLDQAYGIERPPPALTADRWVTTFGPLAEASSRQFFSPAVRKRVLVVLSDAETRDFDAGDVLRRLRRSGTTPVVVRFWEPGERIYNGRRPVGGYRAVQPAELVTLRAAGWPAFAEDELSAAIARVRATVGRGPTAHVSYDRRTTSVAPFVALVAFAPLLLLLAGPVMVRSPRRGRRDGRAPAAATPSAAGRLATRSTR